MREKEEEGLIKEIEGGRKRAAIRLCQMSLSQLGLVELLHFDC